MIPLFDISHQTEGLLDEVVDAWAQILHSGTFVGGPEVEELEAGFAGLHDVDHAVAVANGTVALELTLRAMGLESGAEVIVPANSFIATAEAVSNAGGVPVFADVRADTANIDPESVKNLIGERTQGVIGVHLYGTPFDVKELKALCGRHSLFLIEDAAQAHMAEVDDRPVGGWGDAAAFSFYPGKNLGAPGEGGMVTTNDIVLASCIARLRDHGQSEKNVSTLVGTNGRMSEIVAATLNLKLPRLPEWNEARRFVASAYRSLLADEERLSILEAPYWTLPVFHLFTVEVEDRNAVRERMHASNVETGVHYPTPIHLQPAYQHLGYRRGDVPVAETRAKRLISLPMYPGLQPESIEQVADVLRAAVK